MTERIKRRKRAAQPPEVNNINNIDESNKNYLKLYNIFSFLIKSFSYFATKMYIKYKQKQINNFIQNILDEFTIKPKVRKVERKLVPVIEKLTIEELMETNTYQKFNKCIEKVFESTEESDTLFEFGIYNNNYLKLKLFSIMYV